MATKTAKKKTTTAKKAPAVKKASGKGILYEKYPDGHKATGKYKFFYILFAVTTVVFAILSVILLITSIDIYNEYSSIKACNRNHKTCVIKYFDESGNEIEE